MARGGAPYGKKSKGTNLILSSVACQIDFGWSGQRSNRTVIIRKREINKKMTNLKRSDFQAHPFHLVSPSPWPFYTSISLLTLTCAGVLTMHSFSNASYFLFLALITLVLCMSLWWRDVISEGTVK